jgi:invasion protein IalB
MGARGWLMAAIGLSLCMPAARAQNVPPRLLGTHGGWSAFTFEENRAPVCYMIARPSKTEGRTRNRGEVFAMVTHRPQEDSLDVVSITAGYTYQANSKVTVRIGKDRFVLQPNGDMAWTTSPEDDRKLSAAIRAGATMTVQGTSARGTATKDTFSLTGTGAAYKAIAEACGLANRG